MRVLQKPLKKFRFISIFLIGKCLSPEKLNVDILFNPTQNVKKEKVVGLTPEEIEKLLAPKRRGSREQKEAEQKHAQGAISLGPLRLVDTPNRCVSRGCGTQTHITINKIHFCIVHALNELNYIIMIELLPINTSLCNCNAGKFSKFNRHTEECPLAIKELAKSVS